MKSIGDLIAQSHMALREHASYEVPAHDFMQAAAGEQYAGQHDWFAFAVDDFGRAGLDIEKQPDSAIIKRRASND